MNTWFLFVVVVVVFFEIFCFFILKSGSFLSNLSCVLFETIIISSSSLIFWFVLIIDEILFDWISCFFSVIASCLSNDTNNDSLLEKCRRLICSLKTKKKK
jgi:hypothetical protein